MEIITNGELKEKTQSFIQKNGLQLAVSAIGLLVTVLNLYLASKLAPLAMGIRDLEFRVLAIETRNVNIDPLVPRFIAAEEHLKSIDENIKDLKESQIRMEGKIDTFIIK